MPGDERIRETAATLREDGLVLCVRQARAEGLLEACRAALAGGLRVFEVTLTTPAAPELIGALAKEPGALVGGGTVLSPADVEAVAAAGGRFAFSPVFDPDVVDAAEELGLLAVPGAATPTEILAAHRHGARIVKVFPIRALGGPDYLRAVRGPLPQVPLLPTNGPCADDLAEYFAAGAVAVGVGAEVFPPGFTGASVHIAAQRLRAAREAARAGLPAPGAAARVEVTPIDVGGTVVQGVACGWEGGQYITLVAPKGMVACGIFDPAVCERFDFAIAMAHGTPELPLARPADVLDAVVDTVSPHAVRLGIEPGMKGRDALRRLL